MKINTSLSRLSLGILSSITLLSGVSTFANTPQIDTIVYEGEIDEHIIITADNTGNSTLYFGDTLNHFLQWNTDDNAFIFSNNVDFGGNQALNMRIEHIATANIPTCNADNSGRLYYNTDNSESYVCNSSNWKQIDEETVSTVVPFIDSVSPNTIEITETTSVSIKGKGFAPQSILIIPGFNGVISNFNLISPSEITVDITPDNTTHDGSYDFLIDTAGKKNIEWTGNGINIMNMFSTIDIIPGTPTTPWQRLTDVQIANGSIFPTDTGSYSFDQGGSFGTTPASDDFVLTFNPKYITGKNTGGFAFIGLDAFDPDVKQNSIDYAFYFKGDELQIYENDALKFAYGSYNINDTYKIQRISNIMHYIINNTIIYTSTINSGSPLLFDTSFSRWIGAENIKLTY